MNGGRLQTNAAVFFTKYKNVQIPGSIPTYDAGDNVNGFAGSLTNAAEFQNTPRHSGNLTASYDWPLVLNGRSGTVPLMNSVSYKSRVYQSEFVRTGANAALDATVPGNLLLAQDGYTLWDAGMVWTSSDRKMQVGLHGRNLTDNRYKVAGYDFSGFFNTVTAFYGDPRTVKASVNLKF